MKVSVIIVNYNVRYFLEVCLRSVQKALEGLEGEIIVVDNHSSDGSLEMIREQFPGLVLLANQDNTGFSKANNQGVAIAQGEYILFLNPDTVLPEDFFLKMLPYMDAHPEAGGIGPRLIDGKGVYAPDGKKSFPTLSVALFKALGLNRLFPRSPYFNKYYAVHIGEHETAEVDVLSGCCMMVRRELLPRIGGAFDEDFFMYCEDVDLCYRICKAGYKNIYFPETTIIHYKGESTKKASLSYIRIFNEALATFVRKHYGKQSAGVFLFFINLGIILRAFTGILRRGLKALHMPIFDALILILTLWLIKEFWTMEVKNILPIPLRSVYLTFPAYTFIWVLSMFLNGSYDQPYRAGRVVRGMLIGTVLCLAYFGLISPELRYSRAIIIITGISGAVILVALHEILHRLGIFRFTPSYSLPSKAVIVAGEITFQQTAEVLRQVHYAPDIYGRVGTHANVPERTALAEISQMRSLLYTAHIEEVIFCVNDLGFKEVLEIMQTCGPGYEYKIHLPGSRGFVGSNSSDTAGDLYTADKRYQLSDPGRRRNKRLADIIMSLGLLLSLPVMAFLVKDAGGLINNIFKVLLGRLSWVGYLSAPDTRHFLPVLKKGILPPGYILDDYEPSKEAGLQIDLTYAKDFNPWQDVYFVLGNLKYLGRKNEKDFAEKDS